MAVIEIEKLQEALKESDLTDDQKVQVEKQLFEIDNSVGNADAYLGSDEVHEFMDSQKESADSALLSFLDEQGLTAAPDPEAVLLSELYKAADNAGLSDDDLTRVKETLKKIDNQHYTTTAEGNSDMALSAEEVRAFLDEQKVVEVRESLIKVLKDQGFDVEEETSKPQEQTTKQETKEREVPPVQSPAPEPQPETAIEPVVPIPEATAPEIKPTSPNVPETTQETGLTTEDIAAIMTLYEAGDIEAAREALREANPTPEELQGITFSDRGPFDTLLFRHEDLQITSLKQADFEYHLAGKITSNVVEISIAGNPIEVIAPTDVSMEAVVHNLYELTRDLKETSYLSELKRVIINPAEREGSFIDQQGTRHDGFVNASATMSTGTLMFYTAPPFEDGTPRPTTLEPHIFFHEMGHLVANEAAEVFENKWDPRSWIPRREDSHASAEYVHQWKKGEYGELYRGSAHWEGFAEAFADYMLLNTELPRQYPDQFKLLAKLNIPANHVKGLHDRLVTDLYEHPSSRTRPPTGM